MKKIALCALAGALSLPMVAQASGSLLEVSGGLLTPTDLSIPGSGFQTPQSFTYSLSLKSLADDAHDLVINKITIALYEEDVSFDDRFFTKTFFFGRPLIDPNRKTLDLELKFDVPAASLNDQCAGSCSSFWGRLAELGGLEFYARHTVDYTVVPRLPVSSVPEPLVWPMFALGVPLVLALRDRRQQAAPHANA